MRIASLYAALEPGASRRRALSIHGRSVSILSHESEVATAACRSLAVWQTPSTVRKPDDLIVVERFSRAGIRIDQGAAPARAYHHSGMGTFLGFEFEDGSAIAQPGRGVLFFAAAGEMVWLIEDELLATESDRWPNLTDLALAVTAEILRRSGHFLVHAGGVGRESRCLLVAGESGSGKSTLTVRQAMEGWDLYGDDMVIVGRGQAGSWRVYPFSRPIHLTAETARLLGVARPTSRELTVSHKMRCEIGELCKVRQPPTGTIEAVICLRPDWTITEPRLLSPTEALSRLGSTFLSGFNSRSAEADLDDLLEFLAATPVYEASWRTQAAAFETLVSQTSVHADP